MRKLSTIPLAMAAGLVAVTPLQAFEEPQGPLASDDADGVTAVNRVVCRRFAAPTGSRIGARNICKTQHEWDLIRDEARDTIDEATSRNSFGGGG